MSDNDDNTISLIQRQRRSELREISSALAALQADLSALSSQVARYRELVEVSSESSPGPNKGPGGRPKLSGPRQELMLQALADAPDGLTPKELASRSDVPVGYVYRTLATMEEEHAIYRQKSGVQHRIFLNSEWRTRLQATPPAFKEPPSSPSSVSDVRLAPSDTNSSTESGREAPSNKRQVRGRAAPES